MSALLLAPHNDDETLFASYLIIAHRPLVMVCFRSHVQAIEHGVGYEDRERETENALSQLGSPLWMQSRILDTHPDPRDALTTEIAACAESLELASGSRLEIVFAPAPEDGHADHVLVSEVATELFGHRVRYYTTYTKGGVRSTAGDRVTSEPGWAFQKLAALSCYRSQAGTPSLKHFLEPLDEYLL